MIMCTPPNVRGRDGGGGGCIQIQGPQVEMTANSFQWPSGLGLQRNNICILRNITMNAWLLRECPFCFHMKAIPVDWE